MTPAKHLDTSQYNWLPAVHDRHCDEELQFLLIKLRDARHVPVVQQIRQFLEIAEVQFACEYTLFGPWDALVRVWLKHSSGLRLAEALEDKEQYNIAEARPFAVTKLYYLWHSDADLLATDPDARRLVARHSKHIDAVTASPEDPPPKEWKELAADGLVFRRPSSRPGAVKFYTALNRTSERLTKKGEIRAIKRALDSTIIPGANLPMSARASLYGGNGELAAYLVRCVADTYADVLPIVEQFDIELDETGLRPVTYLVANTKPRELDHPNEPRNAHPAEADTAELLDMNDRRPLAKLKPRDLAAAHELAGAIPKSCGCA
jgi:hypothetical protein